MVLIRRARRSQNQGIAGTDLGVILAPNNFRTVLETVSMITPRDRFAIRVLRLFRCALPAEIPFLPFSIGRTSLDLNGD